MTEATGMCRLATRSLLLAALALAWLPPGAGSDDSAYGQRRPSRDGTGKTR